MYFIFIHALYIVSLMILHTFGTLPLGRINLISIPDGLSIAMLNGHVDVIKVDSPGDN